MSLNIGENIKRLRRERDITQERLAEYLDISHQAVSKWEIGAVFPDVTLLPKIANIFGVSIDTLFGIDNKPPIEEINKLINKVIILSTGHQFIEAEVILREGLKQYPNSYELMVQLATVLRNRYKEENSANKALLRESIEKCNTVINECNDDELRYKAKRGIAITYAMLGDQERAIEMAKSIPQTEDIMLYLLTGDARINRCQEDILKRTKKLISLLTHLADLLATKGEERDAINYLCTAENILSLIFGNKDYVDVIEMKNHIYYGYAKVYASFGKNEKCLDILREYVKTNSNSDDFRNIKNTSLNLNKLEGSNCSEEYLAAIIREVKASLNDPVFDNIREMQEFKDIESLLK